MPQLLFVAFFMLTTTTSIFGQLYHYKTGKVLPVNKPNQIILKPGTYNNYPADYGTLIVKENRSSRTSRLINIPIIRIKALSPDSTVTPIFLLNGGPGESNLQPQLFFEELTNNHDIVMVGYRGVDGSAKLNCPCMRDALMSDTITLYNSQKLFKQAFDTCLMMWELNRVDINGYTINEVADDIEITRKILGYGQINFLSFSYGTMVSQLYNNKYKNNVSKMVLIGARPLNSFFV